MTDAETLETTLQQDHPGIDVRLERFRNDDRVIDIRWNTHFIVVLWNSNDGFKIWDVPPNEAWGNFSDPADKEARTVDDARNFLNQLLALPSTKKSA